MLHFQYIEYLLALAALPLIILLYYFLVRWKKRAAKKIGDPGLVKQLITGYSSKKFLLKFILYTTAFALCAIAVAGLVIPDGTQKVNRKGIDIMFALDVSKSMLAQDIKPNRLERAKQVITNIVNSSRDDRNRPCCFCRPRLPANAPDYRSCSSKNVPVISFAG